MHSHNVSSLVNRRFDHNITLRSRCSSGGWILRGHRSKKLWLFDVPANLHRSFRSHLRCRKRRSVRRRDPRQSIITRRGRRRIESRRLVRLPFVSAVRGSWMGRERAGHHVRGNAGRRLLWGGSCAIRIGRRNPLRIADDRRGCGSGRCTAPNIWSHGLIRLCATSHVRLTRRRDRG